VAEFFSYLSRPEVDGRQIGITGASGGGNQTMYAGAWDERFSGVVPVCSVGNYQAYLGAACCMCEVVPGALRFTEEGNILGLTAPRGLMVVNATRDAVQFSVAEARKSLAWAQPIFALYGHADHLKHAIFESPQHPYTKALLECRPRLDRRPMRLPVIDDFMKGTGAANYDERPRGVKDTDAVILEVKSLNKTFFLKEGFFGKRAVPAVKDVSFRLAKGKTLGLVGESGSGKTTVGLTLMRLHDATSGEVLFEGRNLLDLSDKEMMAYRRRIQIIFQNP